LRCPKKRELGDFTLPHNGGQRDEFRKWFCTLQIALGNCPLAGGGMGGTLKITRNKLRLFLKAAKLVDISNFFRSRNDQTT